MPHVFTCSVAPCVVAELTPMLENCGCVHSKAQQPLWGICKTLGHYKGALTLAEAGQHEEVLRLPALTLVNVRDYTQHSSTCCNPSTQEGEMGAWQLGASLGYIMRPKTQNSLEVHIQTASFEP